MYNLFPEDATSNEFGNKLAEIAVRNYAKTGVLPSVTVAQGVLESNYGKSELASKYNNIFGKKGNGTAGTVNLPSDEDLGGGFMKKVNSDFAVFTGLEDSYMGYADNLRNVFPNAVGNTDYKSVISALVDGETKYATDSKYKTKVTDIIETYNLDALDKGLTPVPKGQTSGVLGGTLDTVSTGAKGIVDNLVKNTLPSIGWISAGIICGVVAIIFLFANEGGEE